MKNKRYWMLFVLALGLMLGMKSANAQCQSSVPLQLNLYQSTCVHVCPDSVLMFFLSGSFSGPEMFPHLTMSPGCNSGGDGCNSDCTPIMPPAWPWRMGETPQFGQDPTQPDAVFVRSDCMDMYVYWNHDGFWVIEILANECSGCFCMSFDWQLPVELSAFDAIAGDGQVTLNWNTASESSNDHFEIVRDDRGVVAEVRSQGNGATAHQYTWLDRDVQNGRSYTYHLRAVDYNNQMDELRTLSAAPAYGPEMVKEYALYQNYPNPFNPSTRILFDVPEAGKVKLNVFNPIGEHVASLADGVMSAGRYSVTFDGANLPSGLYFYTLKVGNGFSATRKMLLVK